jgi:alkaline phosphatase D
MAVVSCANLTDRLDPDAAAVWSTAFRVPAGATNVERASRRIT